MSLSPESVPDPVALAVSLGRPVAHGWMSLAEAEASIATVTSAALTIGRLPGSGTLDERLHICNHLLALHVERHEAACDLTRHRIKRTLRPLIEMRAPSNRLLAEGHNANEDCGSPLTEDEVTETVSTIVFWALRKRSAA